MRPLRHAQLSIRGSEINHAMEWRTDTSGIVGQVHLVPARLAGDTCGTYVVEAGKDSPHLSHVCMVILRRKNINIAHDICVPGMKMMCWLVRLYSSEN